MEVRSTLINDQITYSVIEGLSREIVPPERKIKTLPYFEKKKILNQTSKKFGEEQTTKVKEERLLLSFMRSDGTEILSIYE